MTPRLDAGGRFAVATAVRNGLPLIQGCVASVRAQGALLREHVVQDALSTDGTAAWCGAQPGVDVLSEADAGMYDAINRAWSRSGGEFLSWLNADEQYLPGCLASVAAVFDARPDVDAVFGDALIVDPQGRALAYRREPPPRALYIRNSFLYVYSCTLFYRRRLWDSGLLRLNSTMRYAADMDLILRLLDHGVRFGVVRQPLALYTASGANLSTHAGMARETHNLQRQHGAYRLRLARALTRIPRWLERWHAGGFARHSGVFVYWDSLSGRVQPQVPRVVAYSGLGSRYSVFNPAS